nr:MAG TPA: hypothetical protein [Caudoviricetes sp.]
MIEPSTLATTSARFYTGAVEDNILIRRYGLGWRIDNIKHNNSPFSNKIMGQAPRLPLVIFAKLLFCRYGSFQHADYSILVLQYLVQVLSVLFLEMLRYVSVACLRQIALIVHCLQEYSEQVQKVQSGQFIVIHQSTLPFPQHPQPSPAILYAKYGEQVR